MKAVWARRAVRDLQAAHEYIARDDPAAANQQVRRVHAAVDRLLDFPNMGRPGRRHGTRELVVSQTPYVVIYRVRGPVIGIARVLHGRQQWPET